MYLMVTSVVSLGMTAIMAAVAVGFSLCATVATRFALHRVAIFFVVAISFRGRGGGEAAYRQDARYGTDC